MSSSLKLPYQFDPFQLKQDLSLIHQHEWQAHYNQRDYEGQWASVPLRSVGGRSDSIFALSNSDERFENTPILDRCPYFQQVMKSIDAEQESVRLLALHPGSVIHEHQDHELGFEDGVTRLHVPIVTDEKVEFCCQW